MNQRSMLLAGLLAGVTMGAAIADGSPADEGMLKVDGYSLEYACAGTGSPVFYLEAPSGLSAKEAYAGVFDDIAARTKACRLERLGFGKSDSPPEGLRQTAGDYAAELHALVREVSPDERIVVVGYSFGGFIARVYADRHPESVAGLLFIDAAHESVFRDMKDTVSKEDWDKMQVVFDWFLENLGHDAWNSQFEVADTVLRPDLPVVVISRGLDHQRMRLTGISEEAYRIVNDLHFKYQDVLAALTVNTKRLIAAESEHQIVDYEPEIVVQGVDLLLGIIASGDWPDSASGQQ